MSLDYILLAILSSPMPLSPGDSIKKKNEDGETFSVVPGWTPAKISAGRFNFHLHIVSS